ncbi:MAG: MoxR family ATPase [Myxococcales bacterium]|nr:MoxR family ATPase [Myxococcales bacterium]MDP3501824.1 MoxR family ATPase [Myxococcales bacterium]
MADALTRLEAALSQVVVGQPKVLADLMTTYLARGHALLEGVPGVAKTLTARTMAQALGLSFTRIQFTPDLMPTDVLGTSVFRPQDGSFQLVKGPIFTEVLVADEINRTPPKTQAALLEAMEERQVTIDGTTHVLAPSFFVVATQNPLELEGTYPLPEAQLDRFMMRVKVGYPDQKAEQDMLLRFHERKGAAPKVSQVLSAEELAELQRRAFNITCDASILEYIVRLVRATRDDRRLRLGASPRSAQSLLAAARARAALERREFVTPDEVKAVAPSVLNHRLIVRAEAEVEGISSEDVVRQLLERVEVPR